MSLICSFNFLSVTTNIACLSSNMASRICRLLPGRLGDGKCGPRTSVSSSCDLARGSRVVAHMAAAGGVDLGDVAGHARPCLLRTRTHAACVLHIYMSEGSVDASHCCVCSTKTTAPEQLTSCGSEGSLCKCPNRPLQTTTTATAIHSYCT